MNTIVADGGTHDRKKAPTFSVQALQRGVLFLMTACSFIAFIEPSPYEFAFALVLGVFVLTNGLRLHASVVPLAICLLIFGLGGVICLFPYVDEQPSFMFTSISIYFDVATLIFAMMLRVDPLGRLDALRRGYILAAVAASIAGILGYFNVGGLGDILSRSERAAGTFKDPNVLGTFVILPLVYLVHSVLVDRARLSSLAAIALIFFGGVFLSFSRGAWGSSLASIVLMAGLTFVATRSPALRRRIILMLVVGAAFLVVGLLILLSFSEIREMFEVRASLLQDYDSGSTGRFGKLTTAIPMLLDRWNGFGPLRFRFYSTEDPHDVYVNAFSSYGWIGGFAYMALIILTVSVGWRVALNPSPLRTHAIIIWSTLSVEIVQGFQIDTDHWRHFWLMLGLVWGMLPVLRSGYPAPEIRS